MEYKMRIGGRWADARSGRTWTVINPATELPVGEVPFGGAEEVEEAVAAAHAAQPEWARRTAYERGAILARAGGLIRARLDALAAISTAECGKPLAEARGEWGACADLLEWFAEEGKRAYGRVIPARRADKRLMVLPQPVGVVATITAWNFPAYLPARKWSAALAAGCTVVGRPSELTPMSAMALVNVLVEAGLPDGVLNLVNGEPEALGQALLDSPLVDKLSFTGSQRVGQILMAGAARTFKRLSLEMGGSAPVLIFDDVDVERAANAAVSAKFRNNGQVCISPARFYVQQSIGEEFIEAARAAAERLVVGDGSRPGVTTGPLINAAARDKVASFVQDAVQKGASVVTGAARPPAPERGYFYAPTLLTGVTSIMRVSCDEVFGPVMPISLFKGMEDGLAAANGTPYGLAGYVLTNDLQRATKASEGLHFGMVGVNDLTPATAEGPFGGVKQSGFGREGGQEGLDEYLEAKFVSMMLG